MIIISARSALSHIASALLIACASGTAGGAEQLGPATPSRKPDAQDLLKATAPGYATPAGMLHECLGRLVFDMHQPVQWPTVYGDASDTKLFYRAFSEDVFHQCDEIRVGNVRIGVQGPMSKEQLAALHDSLPQPGIVQMQVWLKETTAELADLKNQPVTANTRNAIALAEDAIVSRQARIKQLQTDYHAFDSGLPDSEGYRTAYNASHDESVRYSVYRSHLKRGQYVYVFESEEKLGPTNLVLIENSLAMYSKSQFRSSNYEQIHLSGRTADVNTVRLHRESYSCQLAWRQLQRANFQLCVGGILPTRTTPLAVKRSIRMALAARCAVTRCRRNGRRA